MKKSKNINCKLQYNKKTIEATFSYITGEVDAKSPS